MFSTKKIGIIILLFTVFFVGIDYDLYANTSTSSSSSTSSSTYNTPTWNNSATVPDASYKTNSHPSSCIEDEVDDHGRSLEDRINEEMKLRAPGAAMGYATNPDCESAFVQKGIQSAAIVIGGFIITVLSAAVSAAPTFGLSFAAIPAYIAGIGLSMADILYMLGCTHSFVRDPVERYQVSGIGDDGNSFSAGDYMSFVCDRDPDTGKCDASGSGSYSGGHSSGYNMYGGGGAYTVKRVTQSNFIEVCHRDALTHMLNITRIDSNHKTTLDPREDDYGMSTSPMSLCRMKRDIAGDLECATMSVGQKVNIHAYDFEARYEGDSICVYLLGMNNLSYEPDLQIGCHFRESPPPQPLCPESVPMLNEYGEEMRNVEGEVMMWDNSACYGCFVSPSCYGLTNAYARAVLPLTSVFVTCMEETIENVMVGGCASTSDGGVTKGFLGNVRDKLKRAVLAVMVLAVAFFSIKMMTGSIQGHGEYITLLFKIFFVSYLAVGPGMDEYYPVIRGISSGLSDLILQSGGNPTICNYSSTDYMVPIKKSGASMTSSEEGLLKKLARSQVFEDLYRAKTFHDNMGSSRAYDRGYGTSGHATHGDEASSGNTRVETILEKHSKLTRYYDATTGNTEDFRLEIRNGNHGKLYVDSSFLHKIDFKNLSHLSPWDKLDCRLFFYLGTATAEGRAWAFGVILILSGFLFPLVLIISFQQILFVLVALFYSIMIILTIVWAVHLYVLAMLAFAIITLVSPIFIPMMLFQVTKPFFDGWLKELMAYTLYPVMIFAFLSLFMSVFDGLYFEDLKFRETQYYLAGSKLTGAKMTHLFTLDTRLPGNNCTSGAAIAGMGELNDTLGHGGSRALSHSTTPYCILYDWGLSSKNILGFQFNSSDPGKSAGETWKSFLILALMAFLFYNFFGLVGTIAAELTGSFRSNIASGSMSPDQMFAKLASLAAKASTGGSDGGASEKAASSAASGEGNKQADNDGQSSRGAPKSD